MPSVDPPRLRRRIVLFEGRQHPSDQYFPSWQFDRAGEAWTGADRPLATLPDEPTEAALGYPWPPWVAVWSPQGSSAVTLDWRALSASIAATGLNEGYPSGAALDPATAATVKLGETVAYLGRDSTFHPLAAVDQGPVDLRVQILGAARPLWSTLLADEQFAPGTSAQQPAGLVHLDRGTRYLVRQEFGQLPAVPDTDKREPGLTRHVWDPAIGRVATLAKVTAAPAYGADRFAILEVA